MKKLKLSNTGNFELVLHDEGREVERSELDEMEAIAVTGTHVPIPQKLFVDTLEDVILNSQAFRKVIIGDQYHSVSHNNARYFGIFEVITGDKEIDSEELSWVVGMINSNDRTQPAKLIAGIRLTSSNKLAFSNEIDVMKRHTESIKDELRSLIYKGISNLHKIWSLQSLRMEAYKNCKLTAMEMHDLVITALDDDVIVSRDIPYVLANYRNPKQEEFKPNNAWSLFNAIITKFHELKIPVLIERSIKLTQFMDSQTKLKPQLASPYIQSRFV